MVQFTPFSIRIGTRLVMFERPQVMGIINITPDSFYAYSRTTDIGAIASRVRQLIEEGVDMIDIGAYSSRPGADDVSVEEEISRLRIGMKVVRDIAPEIIVSVDTFRADVARACVEEMGANIINDISCAAIDDRMLSTVAFLQVPYILMHMRGIPSNMQKFTDYSASGGVVAGVTSELSKTLSRLEELGVADIIIDPGFGFSKTIEQNYELLEHLEHFTRIFHRPLLVGVSRKSMITKALGIDSSEALNGTTVLNTVALMNGASILRVHDVAAAREAVELITLLNNKSDISSF